MKKIIQITFFALFIFCKSNAQGAQLFWGTRNIPTFGKFHAKEFQKQISTNKALHLFVNRKKENIDSVIIMRIAERGEGTAECKNEGNIFANNCKNIGLSCHEGDVVYFKIICSSLNNKKNLFTFILKIF
jgi:hypothetical protein